MRSIGWGLSIFLFALLMVGSAGAQAPASSAGIFVADTGNNRTVRIDDMTGAGWTTLGGPAAGQGINQFNALRGVFVDTAGRMYAGDASNNRIVRVNDMTGAGWSTLGAPGPGTNQFSRPHGIFVDRAGRIYVTDNGNNRIARMNDMTGAGWITFGSEGSGTNQFRFTGVGI